MNISPILFAVITAGSALLGVIVTSFFNLRTARLAKESEERRHHKEIVVKAAIENWKQTAELWRTSGVRVTLQPLDTFLIHMSSLADVIFDPTTNAANLERRLQESERLVEIAEKYVKDPEPVKKDRN